MASLPETRVLLLEGKGDGASKAVARGALEAVEVGESRFLRLGEWEMPLSEQLPSMRASAGVYVFPQVSGDVYGVVIARACPAEQIASLELFLRTHTGYTTHEEVAEVLESKEEEAAAQAKGKMASASQAAARGIVAGAKMIGSGIRRGGNAVKARVGQRDVHVSPEVKAKMDAARARTRARTRQ